MVAVGGLKAAEVDRMFALSDMKSAWSQPGGATGEARVAIAADMGLNLFSNFSILNSPLSYFKVFFI